MNSELMGKRLGLLHQLLPGAARFAVLVNPNTSNAESLIADTRAAATAIGRQIEVLTASTNRDIDTSSASRVQKRVDALLISPDVFIGNRRVQLVTLAARDRVPAIYFNRTLTEAGGLMSYGPSDEDRSGWHLYGPHPQGREAGRPAGHAGDQVRVRHQPPNGQAARH